MSSNSNPVAEVLRVVGRDLDLRGIRTFIIRCDRDLFVVTGGYQPPPAVMPVTVHYTSSDIDRRLIEAKNNGCLSAARDFSSLAETLSAIGSYITKRQGRLISVSNTASTPTIPIIIVKYASLESDPVVEIFKGSAIYELCVSAYKASLPRTDPRHTRFSYLSDIDQRH